MKHAIPSLLNIDPLAEFEFSFPAQEMTWDYSSDLSSSDDELTTATALPLPDQLAKYRPKENSLAILIQKPNPYQINFDVNLPATAAPESVQEKDFLAKIISTIQLPQLPCTKEESLQ